MRYLFLFIPLLFFQVSIAQAAFELGADFSYNKTVFGQERNNKQTNRTYSGSIGYYMSALTVLEFNYSYTDTITQQNDEISLDLGISITSLKNEVNREVFGLGLRQFFAHRNARLRPSLSLGYAKQFISDQTFYNFQDSFGNTASTSSPVSKRREDSLFGSAGLQFRFSQTLAFNASINTVFKAFEFNRAGDNLRYTFGIRWIIL